MTTDAVWLLTAVYGVGVVAFALVGFLEWGMAAGEMRRIDRDEWSRGEPWQRAHQNNARDRELVSIDHGFTIIRYAPVWPLLVVGVLVRMLTRRRKEHPTHD